MLSARRQPHQRLAPLLLAMAVLVSACAANPADPADSGAAQASTDATQTDNASAGELELDCELEGYPCTMDEVDPAVYEREATYMDRIRSILDDGTFADALAWIRGQEGVVDADADDTTVAFRLEGGRPLFLIHPPREEPAAAAELDARLAVEVDPPAGPITQPMPDRGVVGHGTDRANKQNRKKALFLEPFHSEMGEHFDSGMTELRKIPDYRHDPDDVKHVLDEQVTPAVYATLRGYDAIFAMTHGGNVGQWRWIASGVYRPVPERTPNRGDLCREHFEQYYQPTKIGVDCNYVLLGGSLKHGGQLSLVVGVTTEFFTNVFGGAPLEKAIIYIGGCSIMAEGHEDMARALAGNSSAFLGWSRTLAAGAGDIKLLSERAAGGLLAALVDLRRPVQRAYDAIVLAKLTHLPSSGAQLRLYANGDEAKQLRLYDLPRFADPKAPTSILDEGARLEIIGAPGDGRRDKLKIVIDHIGIIDPDDIDAEGIDPGPGPGPGDARLNDPDIILAGVRLAQDTSDAATLYNLRIYVDDDEVVADNLGNWQHPEAEVSHLGDDRYRYTVTAELGFDVRPDGHEVTLKVEVDLPEGGISDYEVDVVLESQPPHCGELLHDPEVADRVWQALGAPGSLPTLLVNDRTTEFCWWATGGAPFAELMVMRMALAGQTVSVAELIELGSIDLVQNYTIPAPSLGAAAVITHPRPELRPQVPGGADALDLGIWFEYGGHTWAIGGSYVGITPDDMVSAAETLIELLQDYKGPDPTP